MDCLEQHWIPYAEAPLKKLRIVVHQDGLFVKNVNLPKIEVQNAIQALKKHNVPMALYILRQASEKKLSLIALRTVIAYLQHEISTRRTCDWEVNYYSQWILAEIHI